MQRAATAPSPSSVGSGSHRNGCSDGGGSALVQTGARLAQSPSKFAPTGSHHILAIQHGAVGAQIPLNATERSHASTTGRKPEVRWLVSGSGSELDGDVVRLREAWGRCVDALGQRPEGLELRLPAGRNGSST